MKSLFAIVLLAFHSLAFGMEYSEADRHYELKFPEAFYYKKDFRVQWWYFTGHLFDQEGREFGYELTFFAANVQRKEYKSRFGVNSIFISHFALSDVSGNTFYFSDNMDPGAFGFAGAKKDSLHFWIEKNVLEGTIDKMHLKASNKNASIDLILTPNKPLVLHGEKGYSRKSEESPLIASLYFSYPQLNTEGTLMIGDRVFGAKGKSWFDRELSSRRLSRNQDGWDWFAIQLEDNREIMLYVIRKKDGSIDLFSSGTLIYPAGTYRHLSKNTFSVRVLSHYTSMQTGARYPSKWAVSIPSENLALTITPLIENQEVVAYRSTGNHYWEGTCKVEGSTKGRAYVEMTGY